MQSKEYWCVTFAMVILSGLATWILFSKRIGSRDLQDIQFIMGATIPLTFKKLVSGITRNKETDLGAKETNNKNKKKQNIWLEYFN